MLNENFTYNEKIEIAKQIKNISLEKVDKEMDKLIDLGAKLYYGDIEINKLIKPRSKLGNNIVDYFTFKERLETRGKYDINYYEFVVNIDKFKEKKFIQTMLNFYENKEKDKEKKKNKYVLLKEVYNICISAINIMKPINCIEIFVKYGSKRVLNFCSGWGGCPVACCALNLDCYYGIEINKELEESYKKLYSYLNTKSKTKLNIKFEDALDVDINDYDYDTVFTSPPYYFIEKYQNNKSYKSKKEMDDKFYKPVFEKYYNRLKPNGYFIINICREIYIKVLFPLLGEPYEYFPLKKSSRQNNYSEMIYVWKK